MANIEKLDVEAYVRLLISEKLGHRSDACNNPEADLRTDKKQLKIKHRPQSHQEDKGHA